MKISRKRFVTALGISCLGCFGLVALIFAMQTRQFASSQYITPSQQEDNEPLSPTQGRSGNVLDVSQEDTQVLAIKASVEKTLGSSSLAGSGIRLLSVKKRQNVITLNFSQELLNKGTGSALEDILHQILGQIGNLPGFSRRANSTSGTGSTEFQVLVQGKDLESLIGN